MILSLEKFINKEIGFMDISKTIIKAYEKFDYEPKNIDDVFEMDKEVRNFVGKES